MTDVQKAYLPAAGHDWALPLYDPLVRLLGGDSARRKLLDEAALLPTHRVLDIGCGTGTFALLIKQLYPSIEVTGVDPDPKALARAQRKARQAAVSIHFDRGFADALEYPAASFDRVFSCFMFHHLPADAREKTLREVRRVLVPGGSFHLLDFAGPDAHAHGSLSRLLHSSDHLKDNSESRILGLLNQAAFVNLRKVTDGAMLLGLLRTAYYQAFVP